jgi:hypothetical protein
VALEITVWICLAIAILFSPKLIITGDFICFCYLVSIFYYLSSAIDVAPSIVIGSIAVAILVRT